MRRKTLLDYCFLLHIPKPQFIKKVRTINVINTHEQYYFLKILTHRDSEKGFEAAFPFDGYTM